MNVTIYRDIPEEKFYSMERYADNLVGELRNQDSEYKINEFTIRMTKFVRPLRLALRWIPVVRDYAFDLYFSRYVLYPWQAKKHQGDINHVIDHSYAHLLYRLDPPKTIVTCHDLIPFEYEKDSHALKVWKYSIGALKKAAMIIADSEATKEDLGKYLGIRGDKVHVTYLGVEEEFKPIKDEKLLKSIEKKYDLPGGKRLLHVGNSLAYKNIEGILKAFAEIGNQNSEEIYFIKVGSLTESQIQLARKLGVLNHIVQLEDVIEEDLPALYNICDILLMPSHKEGFGFPVLEAMACGVPVVTSNVSSLPEIAGKAAALVNPKVNKEIVEAVVKVLDDKSYREKLIEAGLNNVKNFTWEKTAKKTYEVYKEVYRRSRK